MAAIFKAECLAAFFRFSQHGTPAICLYLFPFANPTSGVSAADLHSLIQHLHSQPVSMPLPTTTSAESKKVKESEGGIIKYQLLFGRISIILTGSKQSSSLSHVSCFAIPPSVQDNPSGAIFSGRG
jgi:hypothetical protein